MFFWSSSQRRRVQYEDALKHIYNCQYKNTDATIDSLSGALGMRPKQSLALVEEMEAKKLLRISGNGFLLTPHGKAWALQVIRAHRLWESHLSSEVGVPLDKLHDYAEQKEHKLSEEEVNQLDAQLGYPKRDPHGDPIPSATHKLEKIDAVSLVDWPTGKLARIVHIEDEPHSIFAQILSEGLLLDTLVKVIKSDEKGLHLWTNVHECWLAPIVASNVYVESAPEWVEAAKAQPLSVLKPGEKGRIITLNSQGLNRRRIMDLGLVPGTVIEAVMPSALGEPLAYRVRESMIALRHEQAQRILIQRI